MKSYLLLGANTGNRESYLLQCIDLLNLHAGTVTGMSSIYESEPWGFDDPVWFLNQAIALETRLTPQALLECTQHIEQTLGRTRTKTGYQARTIDIDILLYGDCVIKTPDLVIPHPRMTERMFVLQPMAELAPDVEHPVLKRTMKVLREQCEDRKIVRKQDSKKARKQKSKVVRITSNSVLLIILFAFLFSCRGRSYNTQQPEENINITEQQKTEVLLRVNRQLVEEESKEIESFAERKGWQMQTTGTGLRYMIYERGRGAKAVTGKVVTLAYTVSLLDSTVCYSSEQLGLKKFRLGHNDEERGLDEGVLLMRVGDKARMIMPPHLAYGLTGDGDCIPFRAIILYDVELIYVE